MRVALLLDRFDPRRGGLERWAAEFAAWLADRGDAVDVVAAEFTAGVAAMPMVAHVLRPARNALDRGEDAAQQLRTIDADVVHDLGTTWTCDVFHPQFGSRIADRRANLETMSALGRLRVRFGPKSRARYAEKRGLERRQCAAAKVVIAPSAMVRDHFVALNGVDAARIEVIHNGVDVTHFTPEERDLRRAASRTRLGLEREIVFLLSAHNLRLKGAATAIRALARLRKTTPAPALIVIGRADAAEYARLAARLGVGDRVRFLGFAEDPRDFYAAADVYLHPTFYDPCSLTVLEAWASGMPAITTRRNGAAELMTDGLHGFAVDDPRDVAGVAEAMRHVLDRDERLRMGIAARTLAERNSSTRQFERIVAVYDRIIAARRR